LRLNLGCANRVIPGFIGVDIAPPADQIVSIPDLHNRYVIIPSETRLLARRVIMPNGCWEYRGRRSKDGYGQITVWVDGKKVVVGAHRLAASLWKGFDLRSTLRQLHSCDNPPCFNPDHLFTGTQRDNVHDCQSKGRFRDHRGTSNTQAKLTDDLVRRARFLRAGGMMVKDVAVEVGVAYGTIKKVLLGARWTHVA
jgi:hypothetical protein